MWYWIVFTHIGFQLILRIILSQSFEILQYNCPYNKSKNGSFYFSTNKLNFMEAEKKCLDNKLRLAKIDNDDLNDWLYNESVKHFVGTTLPGFWIGLKKLTYNDSVLNWIDGLLFTTKYFNPWSPGKPNGGRFEMCIGMNFHYTKGFDDMQCNSLNGFICEDPDTRCALGIAWTSWMDTTSCSTSCGIGTKTLTRKCVHMQNLNNEYEANYCLGHNETERKCIEQPCIIDGQWSNWTVWTACSQSCGDGIRRRSRTCDNPPAEHGGNPCIGVNNETIPCKIKDCPVDGEWSSWTKWSICSKSCGNGAHNRTRTCDNPSPQHGGKQCVGVDHETFPCKLKDCPVDGQWSNWTVWTACSESCGDGIQRRSRTCDNPRAEHGGNPCVGMDTETIPCKIKDCPVDGEWSSWTKWSNCSKSCGNGAHNRTRTCDNPPPQHGGKHCVGVDHETFPCKLKDCPVDGQWSNWTVWTACSKSCGDGNQRRSRTCDNPPAEYGGNPCVGVNNETIPCKIKDCPVDGQWSVWTGWDSCSETCGEGIHRRTRLCNNPHPQYGGNPCVGMNNETFPCKLKDCPIDGHWSNWTDWSGCSKSCGEGIKQRTRSCDNPRADHGGKPCIGVNNELIDCKIVDCPINGQWSHWTNWSSCSESCDDGIQQRTRICDNPQPEHGGLDCVGVNNETRACKIKLCPEWTEWFEWMPCSHQCGNGIARRYRTCKSGNNLDVECWGNYFEEMLCFNRHCPINGSWSDWSEFTPCTLTCGGGVKNRSRSCTNPPPQHGGGDCSGLSFELSQCNSDVCPMWSYWTEWTACSKSCDQGLSHRHRQCRNADLLNSEKCDGPGDETKLCSLDAC